MINRRTILAASLAAPLLLLGKDRKEKLSYLQIGTGHPHANKFSVYRKSEDWEVVGLMEEDPELRAPAKKSELYRDVPILTLEQGLNTEGLAAVGIETRVINS